jgi:hypothetical protein
VKAVAVVWGDEADWTGEKGAMEVSVAEMGWVEVMKVVVQPLSRKGN